MAVFCQEHPAHGPVYQRPLGVAEAVVAITAVAQEAIWATLATSTTCLLRAEAVHLCQQILWRLLWFRALAKLRRILHRQIMSLVSQLALRL